MRFPALALVLPFALLVSDASAAPPPAPSEAAYKQQLAAYSGQMGKCKALWNNYRYWSQESVNAAERASNWNAGAANGYQSALDAARDQLDSMTPEMPSFPSSAGDAAAMGVDLLTGGLSGAVQSALATQGRLMQALIGIQGAGVLERMAQIAMRNSGTYWQNALNELNEWKRSCPPVPPTPPASPPPPDRPPFPSDGDALKDGSWLTGRKSVFKPAPAPDARAARLLTVKLADSTPYVRHRAARALARAPGAAIAGVLPETGAGLKSMDREIRFWSVVSLAKAGAPARALAGELAPLCGDADELVRVAAIQALAKLGAAADPAARAALERAKADASAEVRGAAEAALRPAPTRR